MPSSIDVALLPAEAAFIEADCWIVVDLFRATTTIATLFAAGLQRLTVVSSIARAREFARREEALLLGEEGGLPPAGFDHGNSPVEASRILSKGRAAVLATTNGTRAICTAAGRGPTFTGALANLGAVARTAMAYERIAVLCAGNGAGTVVSLEDVGAAGACVNALQDMGAALRLTDRARIAALTWNGGGAALLRSSEHAAAIRALGFDDDIEFALRPDSTSVVPRVVGWAEGWATLEA